MNRLRRRSPEDHIQFGGNSQLFTHKRSTDFIRRLPSDTSRQPSKNEKAAVSHSYSGLVASVNTPGDLNYTT